MDFHVFTSLTMLQQTSTDVLLRLAVVVVMTVVIAILVIKVSTNIYQLYKRVRHVESTVLGVALSGANAINLVNKYAAQFGKYIDIAKYSAIVFTMGGLGLGAYAEYRNEKARHRIQGLYAAWLDKQSLSPNLKTAERYLKDNGQGDILPEALIPPMRVPARVWRRLFGWALTVMVFFSSDLIKTLSEVVKLKHLWQFVAEAVVEKPEAAPAIVAGVADALGDRERFASRFKVPATSAQMAQASRPGFTDAQNAEYDARVKAAMEVLSASARMDKIQAAGVTPQGLCCSKRTIEFDPLVGYRPPEVLIRERVGALYYEMSKTMNMKAVRVVLYVLLTAAVLYGIFHASVFGSAAWSLLTTIFPFLAEEEDGKDEESSVESPQPKNMPPGKEFPQDEDDFLDKAQRRAEKLENSLDDQIALMHRLGLKASDDFGTNKRRINRAVYEEYVDREERHHDPRYDEIFGSVEPPRKYKPTKYVDIEGPYTSMLLMPQRVPPPVPPPPPPQVATPVKPEVATFQLSKAELKRQRRQERAEAADLVPKQTMSQVANCVCGARMSHEKRDILEKNVQRHLAGQSQYADMSRTAAVNAAHHAKMHELKLPDGPAYLMLTMPDRVKHLASTIAFSEVPWVPRQNQDKTVAALQKALRIANAKAAASSSTPVAPEALLGKVMFPYASLKECTVHVVDRATGAYRGIAVAMKDKLWTVAHVPHVYTSRAPGVSPRQILQEKILVCPSVFGTEDKHNKWRLSNACEVAPLVMQDQPHVYEFNAGSPVEGAPAVLVPDLVIGYQKGVFPVPSVAYLDTGVHTLQATRPIWIIGPNTYEKGEVLSARPPNANLQVMHNCPTVPGWSGGPVFVEEKGAFKLVALQQGSTASGNVAYQIPLNMIELRLWNVPSQNPIPTGAVLQPQSMFGASILYPEVGLRIPIRRKHQPRNDVAYVALEEAFLKARNPTPFPTSWGPTVPTQQNVERGWMEWNKPDLTYNMRRKCMDRALSDMVERYKSMGCLRFSVLPFEQALSLMVLDSAAGADCAQQGATKKGDVLLRPDLVASLKLFYDQWFAAVDAGHTFDEHVLHTLSGKHELRTAAKLAADDIRVFVPSPMHLTLVQVAVFGAMNAWMAAHPNITHTWIGASTIHGWWDHLARTLAVGRGRVGFTIDFKKYEKGFKCFMEWYVTCFRMSFADTRLAAALGAMFNYMTCIPILHSDGSVSCGQYEHASGKQATLEDNSIGSELSCRYAFYCEVVDKAYGEGADATPPDHISYDDYVKSRFQGDDIVASTSDLAMLSPDIIGKHCGVYGFVMKEFSLFHTTEELEFLSHHTRCVRGCYVPYASVEKAVCNLLYYTKGTVADTLLTANSLVQECAWHDDVWQLELVRDWCLVNRSFTPDAVKGSSQVWAEALASYRSLARCRDSYFPIIDIPRERLVGIEENPGPYCTQCRWLMYLALKQDMTGVDLVRVMRRLSNRCTYALCPIRRWNVDSFPVFDADRRKVRIVARAAVSPFLVGIELNPGPSHIGQWWLRCVETVERQVRVVRDTVLPGLRALVTGNQLVTPEGLVEEERDFLLPEEQLEEDRAWLREHFPLLYGMLWEDGEAAADLEPLDVDSVEPPTPAQLADWRSYIPSAIASTADDNAVQHESAMALQNLRLRTAAWIDAMDDEEESSPAPRLVGVEPNPGPFPMCGECEQIRAYFCGLVFRYLTIFVHVPMPYYVHWFSLHAQCRTCQDLCPHPDLMDVQQSIPQLHPAPPLVGVELNPGPFTVWQPHSGSYSYLLSDNEEEALETCGKFSEMSTNALCSVYWADEAAKWRAKRNRNDARFIWLLVAFLLAVLTLRYSAVRSPMRARAGFVQPINTTDLLEKRVAHWLLETDLGELVSIPAELAGLDEKEQEALLVEAIKANPMLASIPKKELKSLPPKTQKAARKAVKVFEKTEAGKSVRDTHTEVKNASREVSKSARAEPYVAGPGKAPLQRGQQAHASPSNATLDRAAARSHVAAAKRVPAPFVKQRVPVVPPQQWSPVVPGHSAVAIMYRPPNHLRRHLKGKAASVAIPWVPVIMHNYPDTQQNRDLGFAKIVQRYKDHVKAGGRVASQIFSHAVANDVQNGAGVQGVSAKPAPWHADLLAHPILGPRVLGPNKVLSAGSEVKAATAPVSVGYEDMTKMAHMHAGTSGGRMMIEIIHEEYFRALDTSVAYVDTSYPVNVGLKGDFAWAWLIGQAYETYKFCEFGIRYEPASATSQTGRVYIFTDGDLRDGSPATLAEFNANSGAKSASAWMQFTYETPTAILNKLVGDGSWTVRINDDPFAHTGIDEFADRTLFDVGDLHIATQGMTSSGAKSGDLFVKYHVQLFTPHAAADDAFYNASLRIEKIGSNIEASLFADEGSYTTYTIEGGLQSFIETPTADGNPSAITFNQDGQYSFWLYLEGTAVDLTTSSTVTLADQEYTENAAGTAAAYTGQFVVDTTDPADLNDDLIFDATGSTGITTMKMILSEIVLSLDDAFLTAAVTGLPISDPGLFGCVVRNKGKLVSRTAADRLADWAERGCDPNNPPVPKFAQDNANYTEGWCPTYKLYVNALQVDAHSKGVEYVPGQIWYRALVPKSDYVSPVGPNMAPLVPSRKSEKTIKEVEKSKQKPSPPNPVWVVVQEDAKSVGSAGSLQPPVPAAKPASHSAGKVSV